MRLALVGVLASCVGAACAPATTYVPTNFVAPMFSGPGEVHTSVQIGPPGVQINAAYAVSSHLMLRLSGHTQDREDGHYNLVSAGGGWFTAINPRSSWLPGLRASLDGDFGIAELRGTRVTDENGVPHGAIYSGFAYRVGFQGDLGLATEWVEAAGVARIVYFNLHHSSSSAADFAGTSAEWWFFEPGGVVRVGPDVVRLEFQGGWSKPMTGDGFVGDYRRWWWTLGLVGSLE